MTKTHCLPLLAAVSLLSGCVGYDRVLFATKTNIGVNLDTKPPVAEVGIGRGEIQIAPTFEGGKAPPVVGGFIHQKGGFPLFPRISSTFAGGNAANRVARLYDSDTESVTSADDESEIYLTEEPSRRGLSKDRRYPAANRVRPFIFGTDTSFGLKVAWSGMTATYPDTARLALHRKEMAFAPVSLRELTDEERQKHGQKYRYAVRMPSFLATMDHTTDLGSPDKTGVDHVQYFATGTAAEALARHRNVRKAFVERLDPAAKARAKANTIPTGDKPF